MMKQAFLTGKRSNLFLILVVLGLLFGMAWQAKAAESHNMTTEMSFTINGSPNLWTYGHYTGGLDKITFTAFAGHVGLPADLNGLGLCDGGGGILDGWRDVVDPNIIKNTGGTTVCAEFGTITFNAGAVTFGPHTGPAVVRFTVPSAGDWQVVATFTGVQERNPAAAAWIHNGTDDDTIFVLVDDAVENNVTSSYNEILTLPANATIDIVVGMGSKTTEVTAMITKQSVNVGIDIKPGSDPNCFNNNGHGVIPVAILGSDTFDVDQIDVSSVGLEGMSIKTVGKADKALAHIEDVNGDGFDDLVVQIQDEDGIFDPGIGEALVTGQLLDGSNFEGSDFICVTQ